MSFGFRKDGAHAAQKKQRKYDTEHDIRYRGPLSYRTFKILGWICIALSQVAVLLTLEARLDPGMTDALRTPTMVLKLLSNLALPFLLIANFALILNAGEGYGKQLARFGGIALAVVAGSVALFQRYIVGSVAVFMESRQEAVAFLSDMFHMPSGAGYLSYNLFIDLFLCTLLMFFLNYRPKRLFTGKLLGVFRAFAVLPVVYEIASITLKILAVEGKVALPLIVFPLLTVKPPMTFLVFVVLAFFIKNRERVFRKNGRTHADYQAFLKTNRNSLQFSSFTAIILAAAGILDIVAFFVVSAILSQHTPEGAELAEDFYLSHLNALGLGDSVLLLLLSPLMLLFSYTRTHRNKMPDTLIPFAGVVLIALVYIEGGYQFLLMVPDLLASADFGGLDGLIESGLGEMGDFSGLLGP
jgi:hypothetical protein